MERMFKSRGVLLTQSVKKLIFVIRRVKRIWKNALLASR